MGDRLKGKRVLVTQADHYMGPAIVDLFSSEGADVVASVAPLDSPGAPGEVVAEAGAIDVLVANLAEPPRGAPVGDIRDEDWMILFDKLVHPLMRLVRAASAHMVAQGGGKIVAITSAAPLEGLPRFSGYCAARGAQNAFIRSVGLELAGSGVLVNAIAQNFVENNVYYPEELLADPEKRMKLESRIPVRRLAKGWESAELALFLASDKSNFMVGQVVPFAGGWTTTTG